MTLPEELWTEDELLDLSVKPKMEITLATHFACKRLDEFVDRIKEVPPIPTACSE